MILMQDFDNQHSPTFQCGTENDFEPSVIFNAVNIGLLLRKLPMDAIELQNIFDHFCFNVLFHYSLRKYQNGADRMPAPQYIHNCRTLHIGRASGASRTVLAETAAEYFTDLTPILQTGYSIMQSEKIVKMLLYPANREHIKMRFHTPQKAMEPVCAGSMAFRLDYL